MLGARSTLVIALCASAAFVALYASTGSRGAALHAAPLEPAAIASSAGDRTSADLEARAADLVTRSASKPAIRGQLVDANAHSAVAGWTIRLMRPAAPSALVLNERAIDSAELEASVAIVANTLRERRALNVVTTDEQIVLPAGAQSDASVPTSTEPVESNARAAVDARVEVETVLQQALNAAVAEQVHVPEDARMAPKEAEPAATTQMLRMVPIRFVEPFEPRWPGELNLAANGAIPVDSNQGVFYSLTLQSGALPIDGALKLPAFDMSEVVLKRGVRQGVVVAECETDADGNFEFECSADEGLWLELVDRPPLYAGRRQARLNLSAHACTEPVLWRVAIRQRALIRGRVVDASSGECVPDLTVELRDDDGQFERLTTDDAGRFVTSKTFGESAHRAQFFDGPEQCPVDCLDPRVDVAADGPEQEFRVVIGPTYRFAWRSGTEPDQCRVRIIGLASTPAEVPCALGMWSELRYASEPFVRLASPARMAIGVVPRLELVAADGLLRAQCSLPHTSGRGTEPIGVSFVLAGVVHGRIRDAEGEALSEVRVIVRDTHGDVLEEVASDVSGNYAVVGLEARTVASIQVITSAHVGRVKQIGLASGQDLELDVVVD